MPKYYMPTILLSGNNCVKRHPRHLLHGKSCIIITGRQSAVLSGALEDVVSVLRDNDIKFEIYSEITNTTNIDQIYELAGKIKRENYEYVIGIGGGSTLDAAKAAAVYAANDIEPMQIFDEVYPNRPLKVICVPTTAGTGSDTTQYVMLTIDKPSNKRSFSSEVCFPYATYLDTKYTLSLPLEVTRNTAIDAMSHAIESYLNKNASSFSDMVALESIELVGQCIKALSSGKLTTTEREKLLTAASAGGMAVAHTGLNLVHAMGHYITRSKNIAHGKANAALLVEFISFVARADIMRAVKVMDALGQELTGFKKYIDVLAPIDEEITENDIEEWSDKLISETDLSNCPVAVTKNDLKQIYYNALINKNRDYTKW